MIKRNWPWLLALVLLFLFVRNNSFSFVLGLLLIGVVLVLWGLFGSRRKKGKQEEIPALTDELETHYEKSGMTANEISFFRQTMNQTKNEINQLQMNMQQTAKLKAIDLRHDPVKAAKALFKELVKEPNRLHEASQFLYTHLPNLVDLTNKYNEINDHEINDHEIKNKQTYEKLEESAQIIDQLSALIAQDYQKFVAEDLDDIDVEISVAKQSLKRDNKYEPEQKD